MVPTCLQPFEVPLAIFPSLPAAWFFPPALRWAPGLCTMSGSVCVLCTGRNSLFCLMKYYLHFCAVEPRLQGVLLSGGSAWSTDDVLPSHTGWGQFPPP